MGANYHDKVGGWVFKEIKWHEQKKRDMQLLFGDEFVKMVSQLFSTCIKFDKGAKNTYVWKRIIQVL